MAIRTDFAPGEVLAAADLNDTFAAKLNLAGGKILQIVRATDATQRSTTSTSYVDVTGMSVTITPQKSDSAIIIMSIARLVNTTASNATAAQYSFFQITDSSNNSISGAQADVLGLGSNTFSANLESFFQVRSIAYATPATTSPVTYKLRFKVDSAGTTALLANSTVTGQMYAIEVSA